MAEPGAPIKCPGPTGELEMTNTVSHLEAALDDSLPFIYELWMSLDVVFKLNRENLL